jgi:hypothetical protein
LSSAVAADLTKKLSDVHWNTSLGATGAADAGAGVGAGAGAGPGRGAGGAGGGGGAFSAHHCSPTHQTLFLLTPVNPGASE